MTQAANWTDPLTTLRRKWSEVPAGLTERSTTGDLMALDDAALLAFWQKRLAECSTGTHGYATRGWYHTLYADQLRGKRVLDVGSGMGFDALTFARQGAHVTCMDIVPGNLDLIRRLAGLQNIRTIDFVYMESFDTINALPGAFDVIWAQGSLINAPYDITRDEIQRLSAKLRTGGRWIELAYPETRWRREGSLPFAQWGAKTDGAGTPWVEWYDLDKLRAALAPGVFDVVLYFEFFNSDFNWFDLIKRS